MDSLINRFPIFLTIVSSQQVIHCFLITTYEGEIFQFHIIMVNIHIIFRHEYFKMLSNLVFQEP